MRWLWFGIVSLFMANALWMQCRLFWHDGQDLVVASMQSVSQHESTSVHLHAPGSAEMNHSECRDNSTDETGLENPSRNSTTSSTVFSKTSKSHNGERPTLILHIGPHKTATSSIQCELIYSRDKLFQNTNVSFVYLGRMYRDCKQRSENIGDTAWIRDP